MRLLNKLKTTMELAKSSFTLMKRAKTNETPFFILAHEFFDAIPVYQFIYNKHLGWLERLIDIDLNDPSSLVFKSSSEPTKNVKRLLQPEKTFNTDEIRDNLKTGDMIEICPSSQNIITNIAEVVSVSKG